MATRVIYIQHSCLGIMIRCTQTFYVNSIDFKFTSQFSFSCVMIKKPQVPSYHCFAALCVVAKWQQPGNRLPCAVNRKFVNIIFLL